MKHNANVIKSLLTTHRSEVAHEECAESSVEAEHQGLVLVCLQHPPHLAAQAPEHPLHVVLHIPRGIFKVQVFIRSLGHRSGTPELVLISS